MFRMISDLISKDKEFQIMITVPSGRQYEQNQVGEEKRDSEGIQSGEGCYRHDP